jgi:hypothetical protein
MFKNKTFRTVMITVVVLVILGAAGCALYRFGYVRGLAASAGDFVGGRFIRDFGGHFSSDKRRGNFPMFGMRQSYTAFPMVRWIPGLLLFVGVVALVVIAVNGLVRPNRSSAPQMISSPPVEASPAPSTTMKSSDAEADD